MMFKYCLNTSTIKTTPILEQITAATAAGYEAIELWHDKIDQYVIDGGFIGDIRNALDDCGLAVPTTIYLGGWFDAVDDEYPKVLDECKRRMAQAAELGAIHIIAGPAMEIADYDHGARRYSELLDIGISMGVRPAMEFLGFVQQLNTIEDALDVMQRSGHAQATTVLDPFHVFRGGGSMESIAMLDESQIAISHFNDAPALPPRERQHDCDRVMPGDGHLELSRYVELLRETGYSRYLSLELFREDLWAQNAKEVANIGLDKMRAVVEA
jgi:2-keto-myo-inositol isomerase